MPTFTTSREATKDEMAREIDRCHKVIADLEARLARVPDREAVARALLNARDYVQMQVNRDGGIDSCEITYRSDLEVIDAALASLQETNP